MSHWLMSPLHYIHGDVCSRFKSPAAVLCVSRIKMKNILTFSPWVSHQCLVQLKQQRRVMITTSISEKQGKRCRNKFKIINKFKIKHGLPWKWMAYYVFNMGINVSRRLWFTGARKVMKQRKVKAHKHKFTNIC